MITVKLIQIIKKAKYSFYLKRQYKRLDKMHIRYGKNLKLYNVTFDTVYGAAISIGDDCTLTNCTILAHDASPRPFMPVTRVGKVQIGNNCFVGHSAIILPNVTIGDNTIVGAGSVVTKSFPPNSVLGGVPARLLCSTSNFIQKVSSDIEDGENVITCASDSEEFLQLLGELDANEYAYSTNRDKK